MWMDGRGRGWKAEKRTTRRVKLLVHVEIEKFL